MPHPSVEKAKIELEHAQSELQAALHAWDTSVSELWRTSLALTHAQKRVTHAHELLRDASADPRSTRCTLRRWNALPKARRTGPTSSASKSPSQRRYLAPGADSSSRRSSLTRWRQRTGEERVQESLSVATRTEAIKPADLNRIIVDPVPGPASTTRSDAHRVVGELYAKFLISLHC